jgi:hypothetical protein
MRVQKKGRGPALALALLAAALALSPGQAAWPTAFVEVARELGLAELLSHRHVFVDLDGDGRLDIAAAGQRSFLNRAKAGGRRCFIEAEPGSLANPCGDGKAADLLLFADIDNDGDADAYAARFQEPERGDSAIVGSNTIHLNNGRGQFRRLKDPSTEGSGLETFRDPIIAGTFIDADGDGILDLFTGASYVVYGKSLDASESRLFQGLGEGRFKEVTKEAGLSLEAPAGGPRSRRPCYGVAHGDWDGDGRSDLFVLSYGRQWNRLWRNESAPGSFRFVEQGAASGFDGDEDRSGTYPAWLKERWRERFKEEREDEPPFRSNGNTFDCALADYDNDGDLDAFLAEITHGWAGPSSDRSSLLENLGAGSAFKFRRHPEALPRERLGENWNQGDLHAGWLDYDNDGWLDLMLASSDYPDGQFLRLWRQVPGEGFHEVTLEAGLCWEGATQLSFGDYDDDGDIDVLVGKSFNRLPAELRVGLRERVGLFENRLGSQRPFVKIRLQGRSSNRDGIGARVTVTAGGLRQSREVTSARGHAGHSDSRELHFGLGAARRIEKIEVRWPGQAELQTFENLPTRHRLWITEGEPKPIYEKIELEK